MTDNKYLIINAVPNTEKMEDFQLYLSIIVPLFIANGGEKIDRYKTIKHLMGKGGVIMVGIFKFPNSDVIENMMAGDEFNALNELRSNAFTQLDLMVCASF